MPSFTGFFDILVHPKEAAQAHVANASLKSAILRYGLVGFIIGFIGTVLDSIISAGDAMTPLTYLIPNISIPFAIAAAIISVILGATGWGIFVLAAKIFGMDLKYAQNIYVGSRVFGPMMTVNLVFLLLVNVWGPIIFILGLWQIWNAYIHVAAASGANKISMIKAFGLVLATAIILGLLLFVVSTIIFPPINFGV